MNKEDLNQLLDCIYELEGLVHLALSRDDSPEALPALIKRKGLELSAHAAKVADINGDEISQSTPTSVDEDTAQPATVSSYEEVAQPVVMTEVEISEQPETMPEDVVDPQPEAMPEDVVDPQPDTIPEDEVDPQSEVMPEDEVDPQSEVMPEDEVDPQPETMPEDEMVTVFKTLYEGEVPGTTKSKPDNANTALKEVNPTYCKPLGKGKTSIIEPRGRLVFSINDRYRFKREIFNNSDADFNNTLALVASMENYDEAEDYFIGELQWDPANADVTDFLEILKKYFKE